MDVFASLDRTRVRVMLREGARVETHPPGSVVTTRGDEGDAMYAILEGEAERADDDDDVESESSSRRVLTRGDAFGESCLLTGAPRRETVVATYRGATLVEIRAAAVAPMLRNAARFLPAAAAAVAAKDDRTTTTSERSETSEAIRVARVAASIRAFYGLPRDEDDDGDATKTTNARAGVPTRDDDPTPFPGGFGARANDVASGSESAGLIPGKPRKRRLGTDPRDASVSASPLDDAMTARLRAHPLFGAMTACELAHLRVSARRVFVPVGRRLVGEGDEGDDAFVVVAGVLHAYRRREGARGAVRGTTAVEDDRDRDEGGSGSGARESWRNRSGVRVRRGARGSTFVGGKETRRVGGGDAPGRGGCRRVGGGAAEGVAGETDAGKSGGRPRGGRNPRRGRWVTEGWFVAALGDWGVVEAPRRSRRILVHAARRVGGKGTKAVV